MDRDELRDDQWVRNLPLIPGGSEGKRGPRTDNRRFMNALLWMARSGAGWRDLPERFGGFQTVKLPCFFTVLGQRMDKSWKKPGRPNAGEALAAQANLL